MHAETSAMSFKWHTVTKAECLACMDMVHLIWNNLVPLLPSDYPHGTCMGVSRWVLLVPKHPLTIFWPWFEVHAYVLVLWMKYCAPPPPIHDPGYAPGHVVAYSSSIVRHCNSDTHTYWWLGVVLGWIFSAPGMKEELDSETSHSSADYRIKAAQVNFRLLTGNVVVKYLCCNMFPECCAASYASTLNPPLSSPP